MKNIDPNTIPKDNYYDMNPIFYIDFYKVGHVAQYPMSVTQVWSNWTPRSSRVHGQDFVVNFGLKYFLWKYLMNEFNLNFFGRDWDQVEREYRTVISKTLFVPYDDVQIEHIQQLWEYGRLPINIFALPEGEKVPLNVPALVITNTQPWAYWVPNYLETLMSNILWKPMTSATTAYRYRKLFEQYAREAGETDLSFVNWMGHDFSMRGMSGLEDAILSGMGHLLSFSGTDSVPAILAAKTFYDADLSVGGSVPATEHSVMCSGAEYSEDGMVNEFAMFDRLINQVYPDGIVSIVSDSFDLWKVLTDYIPRLKETILNREGKVVIRPDSGDPVKIVCGDPEYIEGPARKGVLNLLRETMGVQKRESGLDLMNNVGCIYGDAITLERADQILSRMVRELKMSPYNMVFGIGSFTYEYCTRDTYGFAMKATAVRQEGVVRPIFKNPITDTGGKKSHKGIVTVHRGNDGKLFVKEMSNEQDLYECEFREVMTDGMLNWGQLDNFETIRKRLLDK